MILSALLTAALNPMSPLLSPPVRLQMDGKPLYIDAPNATRSVAYFDMDGDGKRDLLSQQCQEEFYRYRVYENYGTDTQPVYKDFYHLVAESDFAFACTC
jgi:hypothetical protein